MKDKLFSILMILIAVLCSGIPVQAGNHAGLGYVTDEAGLLTEEEWEELEAEAGRISEEYRCGIYIFTVNDFTDYSDEGIMEFAKDIYREYDLGFGTERDGELLVLSMEDRDYALIAYGDFGNAAFTDYGKSRLEDAFLDEFKDDDWQEGFQVYLEESEEYLGMARAGNPYDVDPEEDGESLMASLLMVIGVPCAVAGVVCLIFLRQMKAAVRQGTAEEYVAKDGVRIHVREDRFSHQTVTRRVIESSDEGGGTSVGRDGFSGSSGKF